MENKKTNRKTYKIILIIILIVVIAVIGIAIITYLNRPERVLNGTYVYNEDTKYNFDGKGKGSMQFRTDEYEYTYLVDGETLKLDFVDEGNVDATYNFKIEGNTLTLIGGEGTTGRRI